ncbi:MAG: serine hydrolase [Bacteroidota bacterium]|nr:serine hydrolase [Bacteroidota bacterium]
MLLCVYILFPSCKHKAPTSFSLSSQNELDSFFYALNRNYPIPGLGIVIVKDNKIYYKAFGSTDVSSHKAFTDTSLFFTGNLSELMVATAIIKLAEAGQISLDDPVIKYLPYFKLESKTYMDITIKHLLSNSSGVPHHNPVWDLPNYDNGALELTTRSIALQVPRFERPGSRVFRSAYNFDILADLISKVSGKPFENYMKLNLLQPLEMTKSSFLLHDLDTSALAKPHFISNWYSYAVTRARLYPYNRENAGSIGFHTSVKDLSSWMYMLLHDGKLPDGTQFLKKASLKDLMTIQYQTNVANSFVGYAWEIEKADRRYIYHKEHQMGGFSAEICLIPEEKTGIFIVGNIADDFNTESIIHQVSSYLDGGKLPKIGKPVYIAMGLAYEKTHNNVAEAIAIYKAAKLKKNYETGPASLAQFGINLLYRIKRIPDAIEVFKFCCNEYPALASAHLNLAEAYMLNHQPYEAKAEVAKIKKQPYDTNDVSARLAMIKKALKIERDSLYK